MSLCLQQNSRSRHQRQIKLGHVGFLAVVVDEQYRELLVDAVVGKQQLKEEKADGTESVKHIKKQMVQP